MSDAFSEMIDRRHTNSVKWDVADGELPMWVADMDFKTAPAIITALSQTAQQGIFGYQEVPQAYFDAVKRWYKTMHHWQLDTEWLIFATGVVPTISSAVRRLSNVGDNVLVQAPVYDIFYHSIENNGRHTLSSDLQYVDGQYQINWADLEAKMAAPRTTLMILCNPHNPIGIVWPAETLGRIGQLAAENGVTVISDEIHGDLTAPGVDYIPFASVNDVNAQHSVTCVSPSKTFNVASLHAATVIVPNPQLRAIVDRGLNTDELAEPNTFAIPATIAAYTQSDEWVLALRQQLQANKDQVANFVAEQLPQLRIVKGDATYLVWLDISQLNLSATQFSQQLRAQTGLFLSNGAEYRGNGDQFVRINVACPAERLTDGLQRLKRGVETIIRSA